MVVESRPNRRKPFSSRSWAGRCRSRDCGTGLWGAPAPDGTTARLQFDGHGRLAALEQDGWTVAYEEYGGLDDLALPTRMRFVGESVEANVVVRRWTAGDASG